MVLLTYNIYFEVIHLEYNIIQYTYNFTLYIVSLYLVFCRIFFLFIYNAKNWWKYKEIIWWNYEIGGKIKGIQRKHYTLQLYLINNVFFFFVIIIIGCSKG